mgnify:FL=1
MDKPPSDNDNHERSSDDLWGELAVNAQKGDKKAYRSLLNEIYPFIKASLIGGLANTDWAEDITQEALISVHKSLNTYSGDRPFKPWLMAIVNFRRTDFLRKHYNKKDHEKTTLDNPDFLKNYVTNPGASGEYKDIEKALASVTPEQSEIFKKLKVEGYTAKEVAKAMNMSESAVKVSAHRTMKKLQDMLT